MSTRSATRKAHAPHLQRLHLLHVTAHATGRRHALHDVLDITLLLLLGVAAWFMWPAAFGGNTRFIVVQGRSMEPVFHLGDAIVVKALAHPQVGDIIVFHIPEGEPAAGMLVVHRIHGIRPDGTFQTKGDNRQYPDQFKIRPGDIVGSPDWTLPHFGRMINLVSSPVVVGIAFGLMSMLFFLPQAWKADEDEPSDDDDLTAGDDIEEVDPDADDVHSFASSAADR
ncbi:MAG: hypothetical protein RJA49_610 [Actinomycetota bacterium]|jgi:signal peptidase